MSNPFADLIPQKNKVSSNNPFSDLIPKEAPFSPKYKASIGGAKTIIPNVAKTFGNIPSNAGKIIDTTLQSTAGNIGRSIEETRNIYKEQGFKEGTKNIAKGFAEVGSKIFKAPGELLVGKNDKMLLEKDLTPIQQSATRQRDEILNKIQEAKKAGRDTSALMKALKYNQEQIGFISEQIGTPEDRNLKAIETISNIVKYPIERPLDAPLALYAGPNKQGKDLITRVASPVTRGADTSLTNIATQATNKVKGIATNRIPKAIDDLESKYIEWSSGTKPGKKLVNKVEQKTGMLNNAGTQGRTPMRVLAEDGIVPNTTGTKFNTFDQAQEFRESTKKLRDLNKQAIKEAELSTPKITLDDLEKEARALANTERNIASGDAPKLLRDIKSEFADLRNAYGDEIPLNQVNLIKEARWEKSFGNKGLVDADKLRKNSDYLIGKASQKTIEKTARQAGNTELAQLNREIGDRIEASKFLESLDGKVLKGGRVGKYVGTLIGASMGQSIPGTIIGAIGGNAVASVLIKSSVNSPIRRFILRNLKTKDPKSYQATLEWLINQDLLRNTRLQLPAPSGVNTTINQGRAVPVMNKSNKVDYVGSETVAQSKSPNAQQTIPAITNVSKKPISKTVKKVKPKVNPKTAPETAIVRKVDPLIQEAKKYKSAEEFMKAQGQPVYRGGIDLSKEKITNAGISVSKGKNVAEDFAKQNGGKVEEIIILPNAKIVDYSDIPNIKFKNLNDYSPELDTGNRQIWKDLEVEYQKAIDWAKLNGYDGVKLPLEGETRVINPDVLKTKSQLTDIWKKAQGKVK